MVADFLLLSLEPGQFFQGLGIFEEHANFLLNRGHGTFADLQRLEEKIRETVAARTGIALEREVIYVSPDGEKY